MAFVNEIEMKHRCKKMKTIIMSIKPKYADLILSGKKKIEIRKRFLGIKDNAKCKILIYETKPIGKITGEFICSNYARFYPHQYTKLRSRIAKEACIAEEELLNYDRNPTEGIMVLQIDNPIKYDFPKTLAEFGLSRPPQSWQYLK